MRCKASQPGPARLSSDEDFEWASPAAKDAGRVSSLRTGIMCIIIQYLQGLPARKNAHTHSRTCGQGNGEREGERSSTADKYRRQALETSTASLRANKLVGDGMAHAIQGAVQGLQRTDLRLLLRLRAVQVKFNCD